MPHQILERLGIHSCLRHIAAIGMAADMRRYIRHLNSENIVVPLDHVVEPMLPMHRHLWKSFFIQKQESGIAIHHFFKPWFFPVLHNRLETPEHILSHGQLPRSCIRLSRFNDQPHVGCPLQLVVDIDDPVFQVNILEGQPAEFGNTHSCVEQNVDHLVILAVDVIVMDELQELPHLVFCNRLPCHAVIDNHSCQFKGKGILMQHIIIHRHLESRTEDATHGFDGTVPLPVLLQLDQKELCVSFPITVPF